MPENLPPVLRWEYRRTDEPLAMPSDFDDLGASQYETVEVEVERDAARQVLQDIRDAIDERSRQYYVETVVVDIEAYIDADVFCRCAYGESLQRVVGPKVVLSDSMVTPAIPIEDRVEEYLFDEGGDDA